MINFILSLSTVALSWYVISVILDKENLRLYKIKISWFDGDCNVSHSETSTVGKNTLKLIENYCASGKQGVILESVEKVEEI